MNTSATGQLSIDELTLTYKKFGFYEVTEYEIAIMYSKVDRDSSGMLSFNEFLITMVSPNDIVKKEKVLKAFKAFDLDGSGSVSINEMQHFLSPKQKIPEWIWREVLLLEDNEDLRIEIGIEEFKNFLLRLFCS